MPVTFVIQVIVPFILKVVQDAAPGFVAAEIVGTPEERLATVVLVLVFGVGTGGYGIEAGVVAQDGVVGVPHVRGRLHHLAGDTVPA